MTQENNVLEELGKLIADGTLSLDEVMNHISESVHPTDMSIISFHTTDDVKVRKCGSASLRTQLVIYAHELALTIRQMGDNVGSDEEQRNQALDSIVENMRIEMNSNNG